MRRRKVVSTVAQKEADTKEVPKVDMGVISIEDVEKGEVDPPHVLITVRLVMSHDFVPNRVYSMHIVIVLSM
jgi:hypothetical protein